MLPCKTSTERPFDSNILRISSLIVFCINCARNSKLVTHAFAGVDQIPGITQQKVINEVNWIEYSDNFDGLFIKSFKLHNLSGFNFAFLPFMFRRRLAHILQVKMKNFSKEMWFFLNYFQGQTLTQPDWIVELPSAQNQKLENKIHCRFKAF